MNCEIGSFKDRKRLVDTLPPRGRVNEVRREWLLHEDGALAHRLQDEEYKQHLIGNKSRNIQIREDFPCAKKEQTKEAEEAARLHQIWLRQLEEEDARVASEIAAKIEREEADRRVHREQRDVILAKQLQEREEERLRKKKQERRVELESHTPRKENLHVDHQNGFVMARALYVDDVAGSCVVDSTPGSRSPVYDPVYEEAGPDASVQSRQLVTSLRSCRLYEVCSSGETGHAPSPLPDEEARKTQEDKDAELARMLQEEEEEAVDPLMRDRLLAIETQDKELARLLQEKEKARLRRARERARARAAARRDAEEEPVAPVPVPAPKVKPRYPDPDEILVAPAEDNRAPSVGNIAMVIDPTYPRGGPRSSDTDVDAMSPPYMPIQGQKRSQILEKKAKTKDGCKQQ